MIDLIRENGVPVITPTAGPTDLDSVGGTLTSVLDYATGKSSQSEVSQLLSSRPELVTLVGTPEDSAKILRAAFQAGYEGKLVRHAGQPNAGALELTDDRVADRILDPVEADSPAATEAGCVEEGTTVLMVEQGDSCVRSRPPSPVSSR